MINRAGLLGGEIEGLRVTAEPGSQVSDDCSWPHRAMSLSLTCGGDEVPGSKEWRCLQNTLLVSAAAFISLIYKLRLYLSELFSI